MTDLKSLLFSASGRIGRPTFWLAAGGLTLISAVSGLTPIIGPAVSLAALWPWTCLLIKRLHDAGRPGQLALLPVLASGLCAALSLIVAALSFTPAVFGLALSLAAFTAAIGLLVGLGSLAFVVWAGLGASEPETNAHGEPEAASLF